MKRQRIEYEMEKVREREKLPEREIGIQAPGKDRTENLEYEF